MMLGFVTRKISIEVADIPTASDIGFQTNAHRTLAIGHWVRALTRDANVDLPTKSAPSIIKIIGYPLAHQADSGARRFGRKICSRNPLNKSGAMWHSDGG